MGPPVVTRRWTAAQVKDGIADDGVRRLGDVAPDERDATGARVVAALRELGLAAAGGRGRLRGRPAAVRLPGPARAPTASRTEEDVLKGMNQLWRRNIKKADKAGVEVTVGATPSDLKAFHDLYVAHRRARPLHPAAAVVLPGPWSTRWRPRSPTGSGSDLARHEGDLVAATIAIRVGGHAWYSYGASSTEKRDVRGSNAIQWAMIRDALAAGADVYDLRGITDTLDPDDPHVGLIQFKVGTGGEAVEYAGEWDLPLNRALYKAFDLYMSRR